MKPRPGAVAAGRAFQNSIRQFWEKLAPAPSPEGGGKRGYRIEGPPRPEALTGWPALITAVSMRPFEPVKSVTRAAIPTPATMVAQIRDTTTILRWVLRSAVSIEELFMSSSRVSDLGRLDPGKGSLRVTKPARKRRKQPTPPYA